MFRGQSRLVYKAQAVIAAPVSNPGDATDSPEPPAARIGRAKTEGRKFGWDVWLLGVFLPAGMFKATRREWQKYFGFAVIPIIAVHLWLSRPWMGDLFTGRPGTLPPEARFNRRWNVLQF